MTPSQEGELIENRCHKNIKMPNGSPLKIRTMADDLEKARKGEVSFTPPVFDASAPLKVKTKFSSHASEPAVPKEKKSLKDILIQLGEDKSGSELSETDRQDIKEKTEKTKENDSSDLKSILEKMDNLAQKHPSASFSSPTPTPTPALPSRENERKESKSEAQKEIKKEIGEEIEIKEGPQFQELPKQKEERKVSPPINMKEKIAVEKESRKSEDIKEMREEMGLLRDQEETKEEIAEIEKKLEDKKREFEEIKRKKNIRKEEKMEESEAVDFAAKKKLKFQGGALEAIEKEAAKETDLPFEAPYLSPGARLLYNKPEHHSSVLNKVKEKREETEISGLKETLKKQEPSKKEKKKTPEQEYKKFKKSFKIGQQTRLAEKMSKRFVLSLAGIVVIGIISISVWYLFFKEPPEDLPPSAPEVTMIEDIKEFHSINEITVEIEENGASLIAKINAQAARMEREGKISNISKVTVKKNGAAVPLEKLLEELKIEMPAEILNLFNDNKYNLLLFKEKTGAKRLGLAMVTDNPSTARLKFQSWESENIASRKIHRAFEPLFMGSRVSLVSQEGFKTGEYLSVKMRYLQIPDQNTSLDYLIYGDILAITTSKDSIFQVIEILISS